jgi:hypothetical protein
LAKATAALVEMTHSPSTSALGLEFNAFLFASIGGDAAEAPLSVVSALARLDIDPWQEAADLNRLPRETAARRLDALLAKLPGGLPADQDSETIATRLIALLPRSDSPEIASRGTLPGAGALVGPRAAIVVSLIVAAVFMTTLYVMASRLPAAQVAAKPGPASSVAASQTRPPTSGQ